MSSSTGWHAVRWLLLSALFLALPSCGPAKVEPVVATIFVPLNAKSEERQLVEILRAVASLEGCELRDGSSSVERTSEGTETLQVALYTWYGKTNDLEVLLSNFWDHRSPQVMFYSGRDPDRSLRIRKHLTAQIVSRWPKARIYGPTETGRAGGPTPGPPLRSWND